MFLWRNQKNIMSILCLIWSFGDSCTCLVVVCLCPEYFYTFPDLFVGEKELEGDTPIRSQLKTPDGKRPSIFLRYKDKDPDRGVIKVYPGGLK